MNVKIIDKIDVSPAMRMIKSDAFWLYSAKEWQRVLYDYIPHDTNQLRQNVRYSPKEICYVVPYANYIYYGKKMIDPEFKVGGFTHDGVIWWSRPNVSKVETNAPLKLRNGSRLWDKKAISEKKDLILIRSMQNYIDQRL